MVTNERIELCIKLLESLMEDYIEEHSVFGLMKKMKEVGFTEEAIWEILDEHMPPDEMNT